MLTVLREGNMEEKEFKEKLGEFLERGERKTREQDERKIERSTFNPEYKWLERPNEENSYWSSKGVSWGDKVMWARMRCGNIGRAGNKGYKDESCRLCGEGREDLEHILRCEAIKGGILKVWWDHWAEKGQHESIAELLGGKPKQELCKLVREWEKLIKKREAEQSEEADPHSLSSER